MIVVMDLNHTIYHENFDFKTSEVTISLRHDTKEKNNDETCENFFSNLNSNIKYFVKIAIFHDSAFNVDNDN